MKKKLIYPLLIIFMFTALGCKKTVNRVEEKPNIEVSNEKQLSLNIVTTNKLLYYMVKDIVGNRHCVDYMFTSENRLLNYKYSEDSINNISKKDLFFYWSSGFEHWSNDFVDKLSKTKVGPIDISRGVKTITFDKEIKYQDIIIKDNPYFWMNPDFYKIALLNIKNAIQDKDTKDRSLYEENFSKAIKEVEGYQKKLKEASEKLKDYTFVVDGDEFDYFTKYYGLKTLKVYNYGYKLSTKEIEDNAKIENKLAEAKNVVFLYNIEDEMKANESLIKKYNLKAANIIIYSDNMKYSDILDNNIKNLEKLIVSP